MTKLVWDQPGDRRYETGIDRGILFLPELGNGVAWNGLSSIVETLSREVKSYYIDGIKYLDHIVPGAYSAKLQAFTYPSALENLLGGYEFAPGVFLHDQRGGKLFSLSYRTQMGNDLDPDYAYKIHIIYNVLAIPNDATFNTLSDSVSVQPFEWTLTGIPPAVYGGIRPTCHISVDSRYVTPDTLSAIEDMIYGTDEYGEDSHLVPFIDLLNLVDSLRGDTPS